MRNGAKTNGGIKLGGKLSRLARCFDLGVLRDIRRLVGAVEVGDLVSVLISCSSLLSSSELVFVNISRLASDSSENMGLEVISSF